MGQKKGQFYFNENGECVTVEIMGEHVQKVNDGKEWYIVPLCKKCNSKKSTEVFSVKANDLVAVSEIQALSKE